MYDEDVCSECDCYQSGVESFQTDCEKVQHIMRGPM